MFCEYTQAAISETVYEIIDEEPYYGEAPELKGVWATGKTPEECHENSKMAIEDWIAFSLRFNLPILVIEGQAIKAPVEAQNTSRLCPFSWNGLIRKLHALGFEGPYTGIGPHPLMWKEAIRVMILNHHRADICADLIKKILRPR